MVVHATFPGRETRVQRESQALVEAGIEVDVLCLRGEGEARHEVIDGLQVWRLPVDRHRGSGMASQLLEYLAFFLLVLGFFTYRHLRRRYDTVQVHNLPDFLVFAVVAAKATGTPVILDLHDLMPEFMAYRIGGDLRHRLVRLLLVQERLATRFADAVITVTDQWRDVLVGRGVPPDKLHVVMNVADSNLFSREEQHRDPDRPYTIFYHGTMAHRYGVDLLVRAVGELRSEIPDVCLVLLGDGEARSDLVQLAGDLGLEDRIDFVDGTLPASELPGRIRAADVGVVPNRDDLFTDGILPTKLMEYVAVGVPVVAARTSGVSRYFEPSMVEFFDPGDEADLARALKHVLDDEGRRREMVQSSDAFNQRYPWDEIAGRYVQLIADLRSERLGDEATPGG